ncbi:MAG: CrcB family protein [Actinomycetaceae bacterium]|nr:CrcB family protein [Arcanobacterium sp.]MDD7686835.1 CrcB family protein [Actinomycetaceae bacterium]MDY5273582.1 CrcB family protein [Arcanobacterium sp.]
MALNALLVFCGGLCGTLARFGIVQAIPTHAAPFPLAVGLANISGAFLLGMLVAVLERAVPDACRRARWRAFAGTGFLGGFTTYSALVVDSMLLSQMGHPVIATWYCTLSVLIGVFAARAGLSIGKRYPHIDYPPGDGARFAAGAHDSAQPSPSTQESSTRESERRP